VGGEYISEVFVNVGDSVETGDLLIELYLEDIKSGLDSAREELTYLRLKSSHIEENRLLALNRRRIETSNLDEQTQAKELKKVEEEFSALARANADSIYIQEQRVMELSAERDKRQLRAGIGGTVTYVRRVREGDMSVMGDRAITIADPTFSMFRGETDLWPYLNPGDEYMITINKQEYAAEVADETALSLAAQEKREGEKAHIYLKLSQPDLTLSDGDRGSIIVTLDTREDVLTLPGKAVTSASGQKIVYYQDEEGMKNIKAVETGLAAGGMIEIVSGLTEGEAVILE
jgi:multidrug efflux pump subunit AcrA (membrane-fusion protein)